jgi:methylphosphotriester-DNA--protein-cysteine methyltransferase
MTTTETTSNTSNTTIQHSATNKGTYVASKSGSAYHFPWCSGAQRIKEENKVWFETKEEAELAGYRPASNCKGL